MNASASVPKIDVDSMIQAVKNSAKCVQALSDRRGDLPIVKRNVETIQNEVGNYYSTLQSSTRTAEHGASFAEKAQELCTLLMDRTVPAAEIHEHIADMQVLVEVAQRDVTDTTESFRDLRTNMNTIGESIGGDRSALVKQQDTERARYKEADDDRDTITGGAIVAGAIAGFFFPAAIPLIAKVAYEARKEKKKVMKDSTNEISKLNTALQELENIKSGIGQMIGHIDKQATWWVQVQTSLTAISGNVSNFQADRSMRIRLGGMRDQWGEIRSKYLEYQTEVARLSW
ncbi:hypothetical protein M408DRAFT_325909 [Serendipita vermifera MAFF 305830]|uniref:Uncharacterized protein n=1 Tax=Serendipita vermifera MAFF 305830 TaxID=933852 RepID=A0A0C2Y0A5_SERVB|nr:hypothetical protein M408DRAFT_325909 [Serendipita vermifera MAFF 305830]